MGRHELSSLAGLAVIFFRTPSLAADVDRGGDIAAHSCVACHQLAPHHRNEFADASPFDLIGQKNGFDATNAARRRRRGGLHKHLAK